jgi:hypothetical protein
LRTIRSQLSYANVVSTLCLFLLLGGGTAVALNGRNSVQSNDLGPGAQVKAPDVAANAVVSSDVRNGSLGLGDLNAGSRAHMLEFAVPRNFERTTIAKAGNLRLSGECISGGAGTALLAVHVKNVTNQTGTMNVMFTSQDASNGSPQPFSSGQFVGAGDEFTVDRNDDTDFRHLAAGAFNRVEGKLVFQTPGRVTTIDFHAFTGDAGNPRCEFYGTAVTSNLS